MTVRAIFTGLGCAALLNGFCYFSDFILRQGFLVGSYLPIPVYGGLLLFVLLVNPVFLRCSRRLAYTGREQAVVIALVLSACYVPGRGLMHYFTTLQMLPHYHQQTTPGWRRTGVVELVPERMLADPEVDGGKALDAYIRGAGEDEEIGRFPVRLLRLVPWRAWRRSMGFWIPLLLSMCFALLGLVLVVHRQWSEHEHLAYPIITFANSLLSRSDGGLNSTFRSRLFWGAAGSVMLIYLINYGARWFPDTFVAIPLRYRFTPLLELFPTLRRGGAWWLFYPTLYFTVIGFAYFLSTDVSLSLGLAPFAYAYAVGLLAGYGVQLGGAHLSLKLQSFLHGGAFFGFFLMLLYTGRHYYLGICRKSLGLEPAEPVERSAVWGMRLFVFGSLLFAVQLAIIGLDWQLAVLYTAGVVMIFVVTSRVVAETGTFFIHPWFYPCGLLWGAMGAKALGVQPLLIMFLVSSLLLIDPREAFMPFMLHACKLVDMQQVKIGRVAIVSMVSLLVAFAVATPMTLYWQYKEGAFAAGDGWTTGGVPRFAFTQAEKIHTGLAATGELEQSRQLSGWARFTKMSPYVPGMIAFAITFGLTLLFGWGRLRYSRWPLHPVLFIVLGTFQSQMLGPSFLLGCLIKYLINKYGGATVYQRLKPLMFGLIAGEMLAGASVIVIGLLYYWQTGEAPKPFSIFRG